MKSYFKSAVLMVGMLAVLLGSAGLVAAQQPARWVRERIEEGLDEVTAKARAQEINVGNRGGELRNATVAADATRPGYFAVDAERYYAAEKAALPTVVKTGDLVSPGKDKRDIVRYTVQLTPGARYIVELKSGTGATNNGKALPGFFDPTLLVEDGQGKQLAFNDDVNWPQNCNSIVTITVPASGTVRVAVSSYNTAESGPFTVTIRPE